MTDTADSPTANNCTPLNSAPLPALSIVIPSRNTQGTIAKCLEAVCSQLREGDEVLVIDDHSSDASPSIAQEFPITYLRAEQRGRIAARKLGCVTARNDLLICIDADVVIPAQALKIIRMHFRDNPLTAAAYMRLDALADCLSLCGRYKNIYMHEMLGRLGEHDPVLYGATHVLRRSAFFKVSSIYDGVEDNALGLLLARHCLQVDFLSQIEVQHLKEYSFWGLLKNDFRVARKWAYLFHAHYPKRLTLKKGFLHASPKLLVAVCILPIAVLACFVSLPIAAGLMLLWTYCNRRLLSALARRLHHVELVGGIFLLIATQLAYALGIALGTIEYFRTPKAKRQKRFALGD